MFCGIRTGRLIQGLAGVYECGAITNILEGTLNSPNIVAHLAGSVLNTCSIDRNPDFKLYTDGLSDHVIRVMEAVEAEKLRLMEAMGYNAVLHAPFMRQLMQYDAFPEFTLFRDVSGPSSMEHRYITEDATFGQSVFYSLAGVLGIKIPCTRSLIILAGAINNVDYLATGMTLKDLGMDGMDRDQINTYLQTGINK